MKTTAPSILPSTITLPKALSVLFITWMVPFARALGEEIKTNSSPLFLMHARRDGKRESAMAGDRCGSPVKLAALLKSRYGPVKIGR